MSDLITTKFWNDFQEFARQNIEGTNAWKYLGRGYLDFSSGYSGWHFSLGASINHEELSCSVYLPSDWSLYERFKEHEGELTERLGAQLEWHDNPDKKASRIKTFIQFQFKDSSSWPTAFAWLAQQMETFKEVLGPASERGVLAGRDPALPVILLTWNSEKWSPEEGSFKSMIEGDLSVAPVIESWSTGSRKNVPRGTVAFLVRQNDQRGIVASGVTVSDVYQSGHWSDESKLANFVDVKWEVAVTTDQRLPVEELKVRFPLIPWDFLLGSGVMPTAKNFIDEEPHSSRRLVRDWDAHLRTLGIENVADSRNALYQPQLRAKVALDVNAATIQSAIDHARMIGREAFLLESGTNKAFRYIIVDGDFEIDAKAILIAAHNFAHPEQPITALDFDGGKHTVAEPLREMGFYVEDTRSEITEDSPLGSDPQRYVDMAKRLDGALDAQAVSTQRREQGILRGALGLNESSTAQCGICSNIYPVTFLVAGHIKKRSECAKEERLDVQHVAMPICVFGCDALFERRLIKVVDGLIAISLTGEESVDEYLRALESKPAPGFNAARSVYFDWHANQPIVGPFRLTAD